MLTLLCLCLQEQVQEEILQRIHVRFSLVLQNEAIDLDYLLDVAQQELSLATVASHHLNIPQELINNLQELINALNLPVQSADEASVNRPSIVTTTVGNHAWKSKLMIFLVSFPLHFL